MNIMIAADVVTFSGVGNYVNGLAKELVKLGHNVVVFSPINDIGVGLNDGIVYVKAYKVSKNPIALLRNMRLIGKTVKEYKIDVIHCNHRMIAFIVAFYNKFHKRIPMVWTCHTVPYPNNLSKRIFASYGNRSIAISSDAKEFMTNVLKIEQKRIDVVLNGVDERALSIPNSEEINELKRKYTLDEDKLVIGMLGRLHEVKGVDLLVHAIAALKEDYRKRLVVVLAGKTENNAYYDDLITEIDAYGIGNNFRFVGWISPKEILSVSDLMIMPSRREGFPLSAIEAFFMRVPVIRTKVGGYADMKDVCDGIECENVSQITSRLCEFLDNPRKYDDMVDRAQAFANSNCTLEKWVSKTIASYEKAIAR